MLDEPSTTTPEGTSAEGRILTFTCDQLNCHASFGSPRGLQIHQGRVHKQSKNRRKLPIANPVHTASHEPPNLHCHLCNYIATTPGGLNKHKGRKHKEAVRAAVLTPEANRAPRLDERVALFPDEDLTTEILIEKLSTWKTNFSLVKRIPQGARSCVAKKFTSTILAATNSLRSIDWTPLLTFGFRVLHIDKTTSEKLSAAAAIRRNVEKFESWKPPALPEHRKTSRSQTEQQRAILAERKVTLEHNPRAATRIISSNDTIAPTGLDLIAEMQEKHPPAEPDDIIPPLPSVVSVMEFTPKNIESALLALPGDAAGGIDALTPSHLKDMFSVGGEVKEDLLGALVRLFNMIRDGRLPPPVRDILFGGWLFALKKATGGHRPIVAGNVLRRLITKVYLEAVEGELKQLLFPLQLGVGTSRGSEIATHAVRAFALNYPKCIAVKIDYRNAFNSYRRGEMLRQIENYIPELLPLLHVAYSTPTPLSLGGHIIESAAGCQQGDVAGPAAFSLLIHPLVLSLRSKLTAFYLDDGTLMETDPEVILDDLLTILADGERTGLEVNSTKCEIYLQGFTSDEAADLRSRFSSVLPGVRYIGAEDFVLLGAGIFKEATRTLLLKKIESLKRMAGRLHLMSPHVALYLVQKSVGTQRVNHLLRSSPAFMEHDLHQEYDKVTFDALQGILNVVLDTPALLQSSLPTRMGGLGVRDIATLALPCYLSSASGCVDSVRYILSSEPGVEIGYFQNALDEWVSQGYSTPTEEARRAQASWDVIACDSKVASLRDTYPVLADTNRVRIEHLQQKEAGCWLQAIPSALLGTHLSKEDLRICVARRLGVPVGRFSQCQCGAAIDSQGDHLLSCTSSSGAVIGRHASLNDVVARAFRQAGTPVALEPHSQQSTTDCRPDGITLMPWAKGEPIAWDVTVRDTFASGYRSLVSHTPGGLAEKAENEKIQKYSSVVDCRLIPIVIESSGWWGKEALQLTKDVGRRISSITGEKRATSFIRQRMALAVQRGNAQIIRKGFPSIYPGLTGLLYL